MVTYEDGSYSCKACSTLISKVLAGRCQMRYTKVAVGSGHMPPGTSPKEMNKPAGYVMDGSIVTVSNPIDGECQVTVQISSEKVDVGFFCTGIMLYAEDPDVGEVPYTYLLLENEPEWIRPSSSIVGKLATFDLVAAVGEVDAVHAVIDPESIATIATVEHYCNELILSIMSGEVALPLAADAGEPLLTSVGTPIHARYRLERSGTIMADVDAGIRQAAADLRAYTDTAQQAAISAASADAAAKVKSASDTLSAQITRDIAAHNAAGAAHPTHLAVTTI